MTTRKSRTTPRFYCAIALQANATLPLPDELAHHAVRVLRMRDGSAITLFDGSGGEYPATLELRGKLAYARLGDHNPAEAELETPLVLIQGIPASSKMDWILEKAVELGVHTVIPVVADRSPPQPDGGRLEKRRQHWNRIVQAASEQCGRNRLMQVAAPCTLAESFSQKVANTQQTMLCHPVGAVPLRQALQAQPSAVALAIGPEGGWSDEECRIAGTHGVASVVFGNRILRTETAGIALVAATSALLALA